MTPPHGVLQTPAPGMTIHGPLDTQLKVQLQVNHRFVTLDDFVMKGFQFELNLFKHPITDN